jgi:hypothetical protein
VGLALLVFPGSEPDRVPRSAEELYLRVQEDFKSFQKFQYLFADSVTTEHFEGAQPQIRLLKQEAGEISTNYETYRLDANLKRVVEHRELQANWRELQASIDALYVQVDGTYQHNYQRGNIWIKLRNVVVVYRFVIKNLRKIVDTERKTAGKPPLGANQ